LVQIGILNIERFAANKNEFTSQRMAGKVIARSTLRVNGCTSAAPLTDQINSYAIYSPETVADRHNRLEAMT
jgi:hypothetical protein